MTRNADELLPLRAADLHILMALLREDLHGYAIMQQVSADSDGQVALELGSLYRVIARLHDAGLIVPVRPRKASDDPRRRYYRITALGRETAAAEARRLAGVVRLARAQRLLEGTV
ncbi:MAG TPA: PadR family transcriptional regulator [Gemmatimonadaceae bacterium]|nr:PadR family transcriptional regulator [Gemmatimonadaceae bacterium]